MELRFSREYLSIDSFDPITLPDLTILTGTNGAGKSHLLRALKDGAISIDGMNTSGIALFNSQTFQLRSEDYVTHVSASQFRRQCWKMVTSDARSSDAVFRDVGDSLRSLSSKLSNISQKCEVAGTSLWSITEASALDLGAGDDYPTLKDFRNTFDAIQQDYRGDQETLAAIVSLQRRSSKPIFLMTEREFLDSIRPESGNEHVLAQQFSKIFVDYHSKLISNEIAGFYNSRDSGGRPAITEQEFLKRHGAPPWEVVNRILSEFTTVHLRMTFPKSHDQSEPFQASIVHLDRPEHVCSFDDLSSGEKTILALVATVYRLQNQVESLKLVLLDEIDSSLHPTMIKNMYQVVNEIVTSRGIKAIIVTHSPTTVALAPENSLFIMDRRGASRIRRIGNAEAVDVLTEGFATLADGLRIFDHVSRSKLTIVTEGNNVDYLKDGLGLVGLTEASVLSGVEDRSGKNQLKTIFEFLSRIPPKKIVVFVWDCDASPGPARVTDSVVPYVIPKNLDNLVARSGIENAFPTALFTNEFVVTKTVIGESDEIYFNNKRKSEFLARVKERSSAIDFAHLDPLFDMVRRLLEGL
jgi:predicted ATPase